MDSFIWSGNITPSIHKTATSPKCMWW